MRRSMSASAPALVAARLRERLLATLFTALGDRIVTGRDLALD